MQGERQYPGLYYRCSTANVETTKSESLSVYELNPKCKWCVTESTEPDERASIVEHEVIV